jgi:plasmid replication initiation protein
MNKQLAKDHKKDINVYQNNALTEARYDMSALQKNIFYLLLMQINPFENDLVDVDKEYSLSINDINNQRNTRSRKQEVIASSNALLDKGLVLYDINQKRFISVGILASSKYVFDTVSKKESLLVKFDPKICPFLFSVKKRFTVFTLAYALKLDSKYSKRMYEMLSQFSSTGLLKVSVQELKERFELYNPKTGKDTYPNFSHFERKVLAVALKEINEQTDITFHYTTKKTGRKVTDLEFHIKPNDKNKTLILPESTSMDSESIELRDILTTRYQLSEKLIEDILDHIPYTSIRKTLYQIQLANSDHKVKNLTAYTAKIFQNKLEEIKSQPSKMAASIQGTSTATSMIDSNQSDQSGDINIGTHISQIVSSCSNISPREIKYFDNRNNFDQVRYSVWKTLYMNFKISQSDIESLISEYPLEKIRTAIDKVSKSIIAEDQTQPTEQILNNIIRELTN